MVSGIGCATIVGGGVALHGPALPFYRDGFALSETGAALIVSLHWAGACVAVAAVMFGLRLGARGALACFGLGAALIALWSSWPLALLGAMLLGAGQGISSAVFNSRFLVEFGARGAALVGLSNAAYGFGAIIAPALLVALGNDPAMVFAGMAIIALMLWPVATPATASSAAAEPTLHRRMPAALRDWRRGLPLFMVGGGCVGVEATLAGLGPSGLIVTGTSETRAALLTSLFFVAFLGARLLFSWLSLRIAAFRLMQWGLACLLLCSLGAWSVAPEVFFVATGACTGILFPAWFVAGAERMGRDAQTAAVLVFTAIAGGMVLPGALAALSVAFPSLGVFGLSAAVSLLLCLGSLWIRKD
jgi:fucose permease